VGFPAVSVGNLTLDTVVWSISEGETLLVAGVCSPMVVSGESVTAVDSTPAVEGPLVATGALDVEAGSTAGAPKSSLTSPIVSGVTWLEMKIESTRIIEMPLPVQDMDMEKAAEAESATTVARTWFHETLIPPELERELE
jgi:hypothetical protein